MGFESRTFSAIFAIVVALGITITALVLVWVKQHLGGFAWQEDPLREFNYHPVFAVLGLIVLYGKGMLLYRATPRKAKSTLKLLHATAFAASFALTAAALKAVFDSHDLRHVPNMYSLHSWLGLVTVLLFCLQFVCGFASFLYPGAATPLRKSYMPLHRFFGVAILGLAVVSCNTGIVEKVRSSLGEQYLELPPSGAVANFMGVTVTAFAVLVIYLTVTPAFKRTPTEEDQLHLELNSSFVQLP